jgi:EmrB/QacA subfamily drug resistance transporter
MTAAESVSPAERSGRWWAVGALNLAVLVVGMDATVLSVALPRLSDVFDASETDLQWFSSSYLLVLAAAVLPAGLLGDRYGRKRVLLGALVIFALGSLGCAYAPTSVLFILARVGVAAGGAAVIVMSLSTLAVMFTEEERPRAVGVWAAANFLAAPVGPIVGGWLITNYWWGWVFLLNVPVAAVAFAVVAGIVPESFAGTKPRVDLVGTASSVAGLVGLTYGFVEAGRQGWPSVAALLPIAAGLALLVGFFWYERWLGARGGQPLVDVGIFRSASFTWGVILVSVCVLSMIGVLFVLPQYSEGVLGTDAMGSGLRLLPLIGGLVAGAVPADLLARRIGVKAAVAAGFTLLAAGLFLGATTSLTSHTGFMAIWTTITGAGTGLAMATATSAALAQLPVERAGVGSALMQAANKLGGPFGSAVVGSVLATAYQSRLDLTGLPDAAGAAKSSLFAGLAVADELGSPQLAAVVRAAFVHGLNAALVTSGGLAMLGLVLAVIFMPAGRLAAGRRRAPAGPAERMVDIAPSR